MPNGSSKYLQLNRQQGQVDADMDHPIVTDVDDEKRNKSLNRRLDKRVLPLLYWIYLLNFLDRGNAGSFFSSYLSSD